jgi:subtilisin
MPIPNYGSNLFDTKQLNVVTSISSVQSLNFQENDNLRFQGCSSFKVRENPLELEVDTQRRKNSKSKTITAKEGGGYNPTSGYGLVNAAAAVAKAVGQNTFADVPNLGGNNWGADLIKAPEAWTKGYTGQGVVVAVLDTGVDYNHSDLKDNIWTNSQEIAGNGLDDDGDGYIDDIHGWNFVNNNSDVMDRNGHGTHVAGIIAGENNGFGVTGIAYNAKIMPIKVLNDDGSGSYTSIANGIYYAVAHGANVINLSLGGAYPNSTIEQAIEYASSKNVTVVMAAGNDGKSSPGYPARYADRWGIAVGAVDKNKNMADFSNRAGQNPLAYVTAPGVKVYSTIPGNQYASYSGTSMAAPYVAGVVALMLSANHNLTAPQIRQILTQTGGNATQAATFTTFTVDGNPVRGNKAASFRHNNDWIGISSFSTAVRSSPARDNKPASFSYNNDWIGISSFSTQGLSSSDTSSSLGFTNENHQRVFFNSPTWSEFWNEYKSNFTDNSYVSTKDEDETSFVLEKV